MILGCVCYSLVCGFVRWVDCYLLGLFYGFAFIYLCLDWWGFGCGFWGGLGGLVGLVWLWCFGGFELLWLVWGVGVILGFGDLDGVGVI